MDTNFPKIQQPPQDSRRQKYKSGCTWQRSWLRHCATSRKVAGSIPDETFREFLLIWSFRPQNGPGVDSVSDRNEHQESSLEGKSGRCVRLINLPPSRADCQKFWKSQPPGVLSAYLGLYRVSFTFTVQNLVTSWMRDNFNSTYYHLYTNICSSFLFLSFVVFLPSSFIQHFSCPTLFLHEGITDYNPSTARPITTLSKTVYQECCPQGLLFPLFWDSGRKNFVYMMGQPIAEDCGPRRYCNAFWLYLQRVLLSGLKSNDSYEANEDCREQHIAKLVR